MRLLLTTVVADRQPRQELSGSHRSPRQKGPVIDVTAVNAPSERASVPPFGCFAPVRMIICAVMRRGGNATSGGQ